MVVFFIYLFINSYNLTWWWDISIIFLYKSSLFKDSNKFDLHRRPSVMTWMQSPVFGVIGHLYKAPEWFVFGCKFWPSGAPTNNLKKKKKEIKSKAERKCQQDNTAVALLLIDSSLQEIRKPINIDSVFLSFSVQVQKSTLNSDLSKFADRFASLRAFDTHAQHIKSKTNISWHLITSINTNIGKRNGIEIQHKYENVVSRVRTDSKAHPTSSLN